MKNPAMWKWCSFVLVALIAIFATLLLAAPAQRATIDYHYPRTAQPSDFDVEVIRYLQSRRLSACPLTNLFLLTNDMPAGGAPLEEDLATAGFHLQHYPADGVHFCPSQYCVEEPPPPIEPTAKKVKTIPFRYSERPGDFNKPSDDDAADLVRARPDQQRRLMRMLGQDPDMPFATRPELDWEQFSKSHDFPKSLHERFLYHLPYRGA
jgi:hypothetical protein